MCYVCGELGLSVDRQIRVDQILSPAHVYNRYIRIRPGYRAITKRHNEAYQTLIAFGKMVEQDRDHLVLYWDRPVIFITEENEEGVKELADPNWSSINVLTHCRWSDEGHKTLGLVDPPEIGTLDVQEPSG